MIDKIIEDIKNEKEWFRKCLGILFIHTVKQSEKAGIRGNKWKVSDTAKLLGMSVGYVSESIHLAKCFFQLQDKIDRINRDMALRIIKETDRKNWS